MWALTHPRGTSLLTQESSDPLQPLHWRNEPAPDPFLATRVANVFWGYQGEQTDRPGVLPNLQAYLQLAYLIVHTWASPMGCPNVPTYPNCLGYQGRGIPGTGDLN